MPDFIIDTCADVVDGQKTYLSHFFEDVIKLPGYRVWIGGSKLQAEINGKGALRSIINNLRDVGKVIELDRADVDRRSIAIRDRVEERIGYVPQPCNDFHILALALLSGCKNVITKEQGIRDCVDEIRSIVGHEHCPEVRLIRTQQLYRRLKKAGRL